MEILHKFKQNGYFTADLYHLLTKKKTTEISEGIIPSEYQKEMRISTKERLQRLVSIEINNIVDGGIKSKTVVLSFTPRLLVFQNFKPNERIVAKFSVKNISKAPVFLNLVYKESSYFFISPIGGQLLSRLAPGIGVHFSITFIPTQYEDYAHRVSFYTDTDHYVLPLLAMGPRPLFDFPDEVNIPRAPIKIESYSYVIVTNIGLVSAGFTLETMCPFSVYPKSAYLKPGENIKIKFSLKTMHLGHTEGEVNVLFETGEYFTIKVIGTTNLISVSLERDVIRFLDTYNTMVRQQVVKIINKSDELLTYMCMKNESVSKDFNDKVKLATLCYKMKEHEMKKYRKLAEYDIVKSDEHKRVYTRIFFNEIQALVADESLLFKNMHFSITPISGNIWPNKATELTITFSPKEIGEFHEITYLDVDGVIDRIPLKMTGTSLPPTIHLNIETLNMNCVYINKMYNYEVVVTNKGHINGIIDYKEVPTLFGSRISCTPSWHCLRPGDKDTFVISFSNSNQGPFFEEINFKIRETDVVLKVYLKGEIIYPSVIFSIPCLDFGMVSVGVPKTLELDVINESEVEVSASLKISSDGPEISSTTLTDYAVADENKPDTPQWPREFDIVPRKISIGSESKLSLKVTLTANLIRANQTSLEMELEKSDSPPIVLPVIYNAMVPVITPSPDIKMRACFIDYPYKQDIVITSNEFWGYFTIYDPEEESTLEVDIGVKEGLIRPNTSICLPLTIKTSVLGVQEYTVRLRLFGLTKPIVVCHITGCGVRPIVTCTPMALHWGQVKLLNKSQKILTLCNDSPVIVNFKCFLLNRDGKWQISPNEGQISPESETDLLLNIFLTDADTYTNKVVIQLEKVKDIVVPLSATGVGTSIIVGELRDKVILGRHFTKIPLNCKVIMENCGTRLHALEWSEHFKAPKTKPNPTAFFNLNPRIFKMAAGEKVELTITGISSKTTTITEMWYLVGSVEGVNKKELLLECPIKAEFIDPKIEVSSSVIDLQYDYGPYSEYYKLTDIVSIKNVSRLPLDIDITIKPPFAIVHKRDTYKISPEDENLCCCICYDEQDLNVQNMLSKLGHKQSRLFIDYLTHKPVEPLRKGSLNFFQDINKIKTVFNLTHAVEERLEDKELMRLQIVFDITKHTTLKSKIYHDLMRVKFKGHKNKDVIKLIGKINFPNILLLTPRIDFQCVLNATIQSKAIKLQNVTPLMVCYRFQWKKCTITSIPEKFKALKIEEPLSKNVQSTILESESIITGEMVSQTHVSDIEVIAKEVFENKPPIHSITESICSFGEESEEQSDVMYKRIMKSIEPMISKEYDPNFFWTHKFNKLKREEHTITINEMFQLAPHRGLLKPNELQYVHVIFRPVYNISVRGILECEVLGGPSETIVVTGQSSDLLYSLSTKKLNFKIRSFHEEAIETLFITNAALLNFTCKSYLNEPKFENELEGTILKLLPKEKILEPEEVAQMSVVMRPGVVGYFHRQFLLEIGHLSHIPIEVFGWGVIPQIYLSLPRPDIISLDTIIGYLAIPALSMEYLEAVYEIFNKPTSDHVNTPLMDRCFEDPELQQGWHICSIWDGLPSTMDIEMAIERFLVINHIKSRPEILTLYSTSSKTGAIPGFSTTPYVIDYGVVITGSTVQCSAEIVNYGPIPIKLHFSKGTRIPDWISIKFHSKLNPGETIKLEVTFSPTPEDFPEPEQEMKSSFNFEVTYGIIVPVQVKALCAVPYLVSNVSSIDFGSVRCGDKIISSIPLMNVGKPVCIWYVNLKIKVFGPNPMVILDNSGKYEPGEGGWLSVAFKPTMEMAYEGLLIFRFHMNPNRMTIPIRGQGVLPHVHIIGPNVKFSPTLPWAETTDIFFGLTNPCPFPIELIFAHTDEIWKEEEEILQLLYKYYNKPDEMLVPVIKPGNRLPDDIINFYTKFKERIKKCKEEQALSLKNAPSARGANAGASGKKAAAAAKSPKTPSVKATTAREVTQKKHRTEAEIIAEEIQSMKESNIDPLKECLYVYEDATTESSTDKYTKGIIFLVHGSPCEEMQCQEIAYTIGKKLKIPTINIDISIIDALCICTCSAKIILIAAIDEMYTSLSQRRATKSGDDQELGEEEIFNETEDEFDIISRKVQFLITNKNIATPRSKGGDKKKQPSSIVSNTALAVMGSTTLFHMDLMQELLSDYLNHPKFQQGFVLDTLSSNILVDPTITLTTVLRCKNTIRNIHLILCQSDFNKWVQKFEETQRENELLEENTSKEYTESEIEAIVQSIEEMDDDEYENLLPELKSIYIASGLENRRRKYHEKHGISDTLKKDKFGKNLTDRSKSILSGISQSVKKVNKKDDGKAKVTTEYTTISARYNDYFKNIYDNIINIANNWIMDEGDVGYPLIGFNGQVIGSTQKKGKKKSDTQMAISDVSFSERGFPLSLIMCPCIQYKEAIVNMLLNSHVVVQALKQETTFDILKCPVKRKEFTVLLQKTMPHLHNEDPLTWHFLDEPVIKKCECNQITDLNMIDDSTQENVLHILSKWHCTCGKKVTSSQTSTSEVPSTSIEKVTVDDEENDYPLPLAKVKALYGFRGRIKLMPGDLVRCKYSFSPINEGNFVLKRFVEVSGWPDSRVDINVSGICDLPRIDNRPKKMFNNFVRRTLEDVVYKHTFLDDVKIFEFGPIFIGANRIYEEFYTIELKNCSLITADIEVNFLEDIPIFQMDKSSLLLEPGCREKLTISAAPTDVGVHSNVLLFCIKDNPEIVTVNIACSGVVPIVEVLPQTKMIEYGKLLLYRREDDRFIVKNDSILPIKWVIRNAQEFVEDFIIAKTSGIVARHDNQVVPVTYIACRVGVISHKVLLIDIYDAEGRGEPMVVDTLYLSAECYDVMVECAHENPAENFLNYGNVKVNSTVYRDMFLLNRGKYNIYYKLKKVKNFPQPSLLRSFVATPECGVIPNTLKLVSIEFECTPTVSMNLVNVPAYTCTLLDGSKNQVIVAEFPICVTIASFYNTFTLFPLGELNFHVIAVGSGVLREVILNNTSKCPFTYEIILPPQYQKDPDAEPSLKLKDNKLKNPPLRCGNFLIMNEDNLLAPGTSRTIKIQFLATASRKFEETINFIISDTCPAEACGVPLKLVGTGAMPTLDFWNIETTFREHLIVKNLSEYKVPESSPHCVFVEDSVSLYFFCVTINTKFTAAIDLYNNGCVACALTMKLHYQSNSNSDIFSLDKYETHIEPLLHKNLRIIFTPNNLQEYRAVLEVKIKLLDNQEQSYKICLIGEGVIPRLQMISPTIKQYKMALLNLPITCLGSISEKSILFKNISTVKSLVLADIKQPHYEKRPVFSLSTHIDSEHMVANRNNVESNVSMQLLLKPDEVANLIVHYNPLRKGKSNCDVQLTIVDNPYEHYTVLCEAEAFMEDVILVGLEMLPMDLDVDTIKMSLEGTSASTVDSRKKSKSAPTQKLKSSKIEIRKSKKASQASMKQSSDSISSELAVLKYLMNFGGCELGKIQRRTLTMLNNSEKVYKFDWENVECVIIKPSVGFISPGEEKDLEITFFSPLPVAINKELIVCSLQAIRNDFLTVEIADATWDNRQTMTLFNRNQLTSINERQEKILNEQVIPIQEHTTGKITFLIFYSVTTEYTRYTCNLPEEIIMKDTFIYQTRTFNFKIKNTGTVSLKVDWSFQIDEEFPARIDKYDNKHEPLSATESGPNTTIEEIKPDSNQVNNVPSKMTLFSGSLDKESVDTWFEIDLPFKIEPPKDCLEPNETRIFTVTFAPLDAFEFRVKLKGSVDNLDPYDDTNATCKIVAKSLIPYVHLDIEESDYLTSGRRKIGGVALPPHMSVLEFNVLGSGCYKKTFNVINPTLESYEFIFEMVMSDKPELIPVHCDMLKGFIESGTSASVTFTFAPTAPGIYESQWRTFNVINPTLESYEFIFEMVMSDKPELIPVHCDMLKGFIESGTSASVTFTFAPTAPGIYESQWRFIIPAHNLVMNLLVVGTVREPDVMFVPTILIIRNSLVGFTTKHSVVLRNNESESLKFEFKGNSLCNESGKTPVVIEPEKGVLKPQSNTQIKISYNPIEDGPLSFKIFCSIQHLVKVMALCVNALSYSIKPKVTYFLIGNEHVLNSEAVTHIYLDETASTYERIIPFIIKNDGSATFQFDWNYTCSSVKKYLNVKVEPKSGHVAPANEIKCTLHFHLKKIPVQAFPVDLEILDGPTYNIFLNSEIKKPLYHFSCMEYDFGKCIVNAPDSTYKKNLAFVNDDNVPIIADLNFENLPELFIDYPPERTIDPKRRLKIPIYFRPKAVKEYEFKLQFWVNSLCEEIIIIRGEGVPLLFDLYEGCQKSFDMGPVRVGEKKIREIEVMNHSKVPIEASFIFRDMYPVLEDATNSEGTSICLSPSVVNVQAQDVGPSRVKMLQIYKDDNVRAQINKDIENALASLKVIPDKCTIKPFRKVPLKIQFKPVGMISTLNSQLNMKVFHFERPLVRISGSATGMHLFLSQNSLQFGRVRKRGCKILKVMLQNAGDFGARFWWQPLISNEFIISPMYGHIAARTNVTFTITFKPLNNNPFIKVWASCNIENYMPLELAMYATCVDTGDIQNKTIYFECPVREVLTLYVVITNPSDDMWFVLAEVSGGPFDTLKEFNVEPNSVSNIPVNFRPKTIGKHESQVLYSPLGESALFVTLIGAALHPNPNGTIPVSVMAKHPHTEELMVYNITEFPESYLVSTEVVKVIPEKFDGYYEIKHPDNVKTWGEAAATCRWTFVCYGECEMHLKVMFINEDTREYQFYNIIVTVTPSEIVDILKLESRARESAQRELVVSNPLSNDAEYYVKCNKVDCVDMLKINRNSEEKLLLTYSPLVVGEYEDFLEISNELIGTYVYKLMLTCLPAKEKHMEFSTPFGTRIPIRLRVQNRADVKVDFLCTMSHTSIQVEKDYSLGPLEKGKFLVWFEPTQFDVQHCRVSFDSVIAGEFVFNIKGIGLPPKPQGPYDIKAGGFTVIRFRNVFDDLKSFKIHVDRDEFYVKTFLEHIRPKKELLLNVYLQESSTYDWSQPPSGCLVIETCEPTDPKIQWMYFLRGVR